MIQQKCFHFTIFISILTICLLLKISVSSAQPVINSVSGGIIHGVTLNITGSGFGIKSPAAPLWWDDGEGALVNNRSIMLSGDMSWVITTLPEGSKHYHDVWPRYNPDPNFSIQYRNSGFRNVQSPHGRSLKFITGGHDFYGGCNVTRQYGENVAINIMALADSNNWYMSYYYRLDPAWPPMAASFNNYKDINWENVSPWNIYDSQGVTYDNVNSCGTYEAQPRCDRPYMCYAVIGIMNRFNCGVESQNAYPVITRNQNFKNPYRGWVHVEREMIYNRNYYKVKHDNAVGVDTTLDTEGDCTLQLGPFRAVTIGGFWRNGYCDNNPYRPHILDNNAWRYFDDVYVDTTLARVMLANNSNYNQATIIEPQIPSAWSNNSITVKVNLGKFPSSESAYLFVFDSNNNRNSTGYPVTIGGGSAPPPSNPPPAAPTGLRTVN